MDSSRDLKLEDNVSTESDTLMPEIIQRVKKLIEMDREEKRKCFVTKTINKHAEACKKELKEGMHQYDNYKSEHLIRMVAQLEDEHSEQQKHQNLLSIKSGNDEGFEAIFSKIVKSISSHEKYTHTPPNSSAHQDAAPSPSLGCRDTQMENIRQLMRRVSMRVIHHQSRPPKVQHPVTTMLGFLL